MQYQNNLELGREKEGQDNGFLRDRRKITVKKIWYFSK